MQQLAIINAFLRKTNDYVGLTYYKIGSTPNALENLWAQENHESSSRYH